MDKEVLIAAIGVGGTLLGTVLGWFLNNLSNMGRLSIYVCEWNDEFKTNNAGEIVSSQSIEETEYYSFDLSLDLYNSSGSTKIMRDIQIVYTDGWRQLWKGVPDDVSTRRFSAGTTRYNRVEPINIPPKMVIKLNLRDGLWKMTNELDFVWKTKKIYFQYTDEKNKRRKKLIRKADYANCFSGCGVRVKK